jgi:ADYC domain
MNIADYGQRVRTETRPVAWKARQALALVLASATTACLPSASTPSDTTAHIEAPHPSSAPLMLAGFPLSGARVEDVWLASVSMSGATLRGETLERIAPEGAALVARSGTRILRDRVLLTTILRGETVAGEPAWLRIYELTRSGNDSNVSFYKVAHLGPRGWRPLCEGSNEAVALAGLWDYREGVAGGGGHSPSTDRFTLACRGSAIAQCVELGYQPWRAPARCPAGATCPASLAAHHQACVRLHRADYCGDGRSWTTHGIFVNLYDGLGLQRDTEEWTPEAEWNENGAICIRTPRPPTPIEQLPACARARMTTDACTDIAHFVAGTLLINELDQRGLQVTR